MNESRSVPHVIHRWYWRWTTVLADVGLAFFLHQLIAYHYPGLGPFITFYPAVLLAALLGGMWAGIAATLLSAFLAAYWILDVLGRVAEWNPSNNINLAVFSVFGICLSVIIERHHRNREKLSALREEAAILEERRKLDEERKVATLIQSERQRLFDILETLPVMISLRTKDHRIVFGNCFFREKFGDYQQKRCYEVRFSRTEPCEHCEAFLPLQTGEPHQREITFPDGSFVNSYDFLFTDFDGSSLLLEMGIDITKRRRAENEVYAYRERLESMVEERTRQLQKANAQLEADIAHRLRAEADLARARMQAEHSAAQLRTIFENVKERLYVCDSEGNPIMANEASRITYKRADGSIMPVFEMAQEIEVFDLNGHSVRQEQWPISRVMRGERVCGVENLVKFKRTGEARILSSSGSPIRDSDGKIIMVVLTTADISEHKRAEEELKKLNRTLKALSRSNQAILHATNELQFLDEVCKIIIQDCGHTMVWIGFAEHDERKSVRIVAHSGFDSGYLDGLHITWGEGERGCGPTGMSIRTGQPVICHDMLTDSAFTPWREEAHRRGYASSIAVPFKLGDRDWGAITIYSRERDAFSAGEVELLTELATDVEFGAQSLRIRVAHARAIEELSRSREMLGLFINDAPAAMAMFDRNMRYLHVSRRWMSDFGLGERSLTGLSHYEVFPEIPEGWKDAYRRGLAGESLSADGDRFERADGSQQWIRWEVRPWHEADGSVGGVLIHTEDITERKKSEAALIERERLALQRKQLRALAERLQKAREDERIRVARDLHDDIGQLLTAVKMDLIWIGKRMTDREAEAHLRLEGAVKLINDGVRSVRKICSGLRPSILDDLGLAAAIEWQANEFSSRTGIACRVSLPSVALNLTGDHATAFFRIFQECLTNVSRHAHAQAVDVSLYEQGDDLVLAVRDDGQGFSDVAHASSLGILGMRERAQVCGGELLIDSSAGKGTTVTLRIPMRPSYPNEDDNAHTNRG